MYKYKNTIMKILFKQTGFLLILLLSAVFMTSCDKKLSDTAFGNTIIYLPQAQQSGGVNLNYLVPSTISYDTTTNNFNLDLANNVVNVYFGLNCSGLQQSLNGYTVTVSTRSDTINQLISNGLIKVAPDAGFPVVLLPSSAYTLPSTVTVPAGASRANFTLAINYATLKTYAGQKVALCIVISNPTMYTLSPVYNQVVTIIDVSQLKL